MKKGLFLIPLAAAMMASCSNDFDENNGFNGETEIHYLAVNIVDVADNGTRADLPGKYENGTDDENQVKSIRFYLFDKNGNKFATTPYTDATAEPVNNDETTNVEKKLQAVIVFESKKADGSAEDKHPAKIVAIVNPPESLPDFATVGALQDAVANYNLTTAGSFVMTNAVYLDGTNKEHVAYDIQEANIKESKAAALAAPVEIYVERVVAKARVNLASSLEKLAGHDNVYKLANNSGKATVYKADGSTEEKEIYVELLGWNVTGTAPQSRLVKKLTEGWSSSDKFVWGVNNEWNVADYHRSFWALNPSTVASKGALSFGNFNGRVSDANINPANGQGVAAFDGQHPVYLQENAAWDATTGADPGYGTKLIIAARLVDDQAQPISLGWYAGSYYLKETLEQVMLTNAKIFKKTTQDGDVVNYVPALKNDVPVKFITSTAAGDFDNSGERKPTVSNEVNRYNSYAQANLTQLPENLYIKNDDGTYSPISSLEALNDALKQVGTVKLWDNGYTYYWLDITHLAPENMYGHVGIVRNHIYDYEIGSFVGFGIPVLNDSETIYPETPNDPEMMYIAARINILSWRLVNHANAQLGWN